MRLDRNLLLLFRKDLEESCSRVLWTVRADEDGAVGLIGGVAEVRGVGAVAVEPWDVGVLAHGAGLLVVVGFEAFFHQAFGELKPVLHQGKGQENLCQSVGLPQQLSHSFTQKVIVYCFRDLSQLNSTDVCSSNNCRMLAWNKYSRGLKRWKQNLF